MKFVFWHHEIHGPFTLEELWEGTHGFGGSVARLRVVFWLAARGHEVLLVGNVRDGSFRGVQAISGAGTSWLDRHFEDKLCGERAILVMNNHPTEEDWRRIQEKRGRFAVLLWALGPFNPVWLERAQKGFVAKIVCMSNYQRELCRIYSGFEATEVCYVGIDLDLLAQAQPDGTGEQVAVFCSIPRWTKGIHNLLRAWRLVRLALPDARLRICGSAKIHDPHAEVGRTGVLDREVEEEFPDFFCDPPVSMERAGIELLGALKGLREVYGVIKGGIRGGGELQLAGVV